MKSIIPKIPVGVSSAIVIIAILFLTLYPFKIDSDSFGLFPGSDKIVHILMFFLLSVVIIIDYSRLIYPRYLKLDMYIAIILLCSFIGGLIEFLQYSMKIGRCMELSDFLSDMLGAILGFLFYYFFFIKVFRRSYKRYLSRRK